MCIARVYCGFCAEVLSIMFCFSHLYSLEIDSAVTWHNGTTPINARYLKASGGRVNIDIYDGLQIFDLNFRDSQPYHCYVNGKRRATFRLIGMYDDVYTNPTTPCVSCLYSVSCQIVSRSHQQKNSGKIIS